ncbi:MAG: DUF1287 domain-containing protein [Firmicutes bacterium]|nr:DUF1287 domain-containing protein [Bacillota bacterium]
MRVLRWVGLAVLLALAVGLGCLLLTGPYPREVALDPAQWGKRCEVPLVVAQNDRNANGVPDALDLVKGARREVEIRAEYDAAYYNGYPPEGKGACTDVVWRAYREAGCGLKELLDRDIREHPTAYGRTGQRPEPNIDFRRVPNLEVFFSRHAKRLTTEVRPWEVDNLVEWQPGDIVIFGPPVDHIGVVSDQRRRDGVPLVIHNAGPYATETEVLLSWPSKITHHFRFPA